MWPFTIKEEWIDSGTGSACLLCSREASVTAHDRKMATNVYCGQAADSCKIAIKYNAKVIGYDW